MSVSIPLSILLSFQLLKEKRGWESERLADFNSFALAFPFVEISNLLSSQLDEKLSVDKAELEMNG